MALTVHAVDGLISRLLQQQHISATQRKGDVKQSRPDSGEHVSISSQARQITVDKSVSRLESSFLQLYSPRKTQGPQR